MSETQQLDKYTEPAVLLVGYRLRPVPNGERFAPAYRAPANYKDEAKIAAYIAERQAAFAAKAATMPYTATFDEVFISDLRNRQVNRWIWSEERGPDKAKKPVALAAAAWILKRYPHAWGNSPVARKMPPPEDAAIFVGFDVRLFLKIMGLECSLPGYNWPIPLGMWVDNSDHRDIANLLVPAEFTTDLNLCEVLRTRGIDLKIWPGPGEDPGEDVRIATEVATQLGLV